MECFCHSTVAVLFSSRDSKNSEHNLVRGGNDCDNPLNMVSQGLLEAEAADEIDESIFLFKSNLGSSP